MEESQPVVMKTVALATDAFNSAKACGECHEAIYASWQQSMHSRAVTNGVFQAAYQTAKQTYGEERCRICANCHAPTVRHTEDFAMDSAVTLEGVTCDFCHSIRGVEVDTHTARIDLDVGSTKYGSLVNAESPAHDVAHSEVHGRSELCAGCHEFRNEHGVAILETYSEWMQSDYAAEGKQCQDCHMPLVTGRAVALGLKKDTAKNINLHDISGSHDLEQVRKAVKLEIATVERLGDDRIRTSIRVSNVGSGHCFPTGLPTHRAILEVTIRSSSGRILEQRSIEFAKVLLNAENVPIADEAQMFLEARSIRHDTRLKPKENRTLGVTFSDQAAPEVGTVEAVLSYQYSTQVLKKEEGVDIIEPTEMKILLASQERRLPALSGRSSWR